MSRCEKLEKIIIGTLLESNERVNYYDYCQCIAVYMFSIPANRRIFELIADMNAKGKTATDPCSILQEYGETVMDIACDMVDLCTDYSFIKLKTEYNEQRYIESLLYGTEQKFTNVTFDDYVKQFIMLYYEREESKFSGTVTTAA